MYHQVSRESHPNFAEYTVTTNAFSDQMKALKYLGFEPISLNRLLDCREGNAALPSKPVIITFDDALVDALDNAVPILENMGFPAVFYVTTDYVGRMSDWMIPEVDVEFEVAGWERIRALDSKKFEVGAHSMTHPHMNTISAENCLKEMEGSRKVLEDRLGREIRHMAYPHGAYNQTVRDLAYESGYYTATTCEPALAALSDDMLGLPRLNVGMEDSLVAFVTKLYIAKSPKTILYSNIEALKREIPSPVRKFIKKYLRSSKRN